MNELLRILWRESGPKKKRLTLNGLLAQFSEEEWREEQKRLSEENDKQIWLAGRKADLYQALTVSPEFVELEMSVNDKELQKVLKKVSWLWTRKFTKKQKDPSENDLVYHYSRRAISSPYSVESVVEKASLDNQLSIDYLTSEALRLGFEYKLEENFVAQKLGQWGGYDDVRHSHSVVINMGIRDGELACKARLVSDHYHLTYDLSDKYDLNERLFDSYQDMFVVLARAVHENDVGVILRDDDKSKNK